MEIPVGRSDIAALFRNTLASGRLGQSYIINAEEGMGKKTVMKYILSLIMCKDHSSCGKCQPCKSLEAGAHPDVAELRRTDGRASIGVDSVREIIGEAYIRPVLSQYKAVVVYEAHLLTAEAQNAMLKIIEEPPRGVVFFLLCDTLAPILKTVVSRSIVIDLKPLDLKILKMTAGESVLDFELCYSQGNPGRLKKLISDSEFLNLRDEVIGKFTDVFSGGAYSVYEAVQFFDKNKDKRREISDIMLFFIRDVLYKKLNLDDLIINKDKINLINAAGAKLDAGGCFRVMQIILKTQAERGKNGNYTIAATTALFKCREEINGRSNGNPI